jgi:hypothetical protein
MAHTDEDAHDIDINSAASVSEWLSKLRGDGGLVVVLVSGSDSHLRGHSIFMANADVIIDARKGKCP